MFNRDDIEKLRARVGQLELDVRFIDAVIFRIINGLALSATLKIGDSTMPASIAIGGLGATAVFTEFSGANGTGVTVAPEQTPVFSSSDVTIATVDQSGNVVAVAVGTATISATDPGNSLTASDTVTVTAAVATSATLVVTANVAAPAAPAAA
jgi:hypothetical protein